MSNFKISTDRDKLDLNVIHDFLTNRSYWAIGRSLETVKRSIENSPVPPNMLIDMHKSSCPAGYDFQKEQMLELVVGICYPNCMYYKDL
jgi:hypothetical protein